jgi:hypothetical protein
VEGLTDLLTPWCVHTAATLGVAERLPADIGVLAGELDCDRETLHDLLSHLVAHGVFAEPERGFFELNPAAEELFRASAFLSLDGIGGRFARSWETLPTLVRTGRSGYAERFGRGFWEDLAANPGLAVEFDDLIGPGGHAAPDARFDLADGWDGVRTVVDVGGGTGAMLRELLALRPSLQATLVDLPGTVERAEGAFARAGQSFFEPLPRADLLIVRHVINDWPEAEQLAILRRCAEAGPRTAVIGSVRPDDAPRRLSIETVLCGGRTFGLTRFTQLVELAGMRVAAAGEQPAGYVVECRVEN